MNDNNALTFAAGFCSEYCSPINAETLRDILRGRTNPSPWFSHIGTLFNDLPEHMLIAALTEAGVSVEDAWKLYLTLPEMFQERRL